MHALELLYFLPEGGCGSADSAAPWSTDRGRAPAARVPTRAVDSKDSRVELEVWYQSQSGFKGSKSVLVT